mgnify:CR=1 FL=1
MKPEIRQVVTKLIGEADPSVVKEGVSPQEADLEAAKMLLSQALTQIDHIVAKIHTNYSIRLMLPSYDGVEELVEGALASIRESRRKGNWD